jgi:hypothetical protein
LFPDGSGGSRAVHLGHDQVHQDHVWPDLLTHLQGFMAIAGFSYQLQARPDPQNGCQPSANHAMVIDNHDSDRI